MSDLYENAEQRMLLLVEDDEAFARTLGRSFERRGYRVLPESNPVLRGFREFLALDGVEAVMRVQEFYTRREA